jgi:hypothetical protein
MIVLVHGENKQLRSDFNSSWRFICTGHNLGFVHGVDLGMCYRPYGIAGVVKTPQEIYGSSSCTVQVTEIKTGPSVYMLYCGLALVM